jgi:hypothetical protein
MIFPEPWLKLFACGDVRPLRNRLLAELSQSADRALRSAAFLELMRLSLEMATQPMKLMFPFSTRPR